ncbi:aquaporin, partial [Acrasis kona]
MQEPSDTVPPLEKTEPYRAEDHVINIARTPTEEKKQVEDSPLPKLEVNVDQDGNLTAPKEKHVKIKSPGSSNIHHLGEKNEPIKTKRNVRHRCQGSICDTCDITGHKCQGSICEICDGSTPQTPLDTNTEKVLLPGILKNAEFKETSTDASEQKPYEDEQPLTPNSKPVIDRSDSEVHKMLPTSLYPNVGNKYERMSRNLLFGQGPAEDHTKKLVTLKIELRRFSAEMLGTGILVFFHAGINTASVWLAERGQDRVILPVEYGILYGFTLLSLIFALGSVSGAHFNPIVTFAFAMRGVFKWWRVPIYMFCQIVGAIVGAAFVRAIFGNGGYCGANQVPPYSSPTTAFGTEIIGSFYFLLVVLSTARASKITGANAALAVGTCYGGIAVLASFVSTISLNPFRSLGPAIIAGGGPQWPVIWVYITGPVIGAIVAIVVDRFVISQRGVDYKKSRRSLMGAGGVALPVQKDSQKNHYTLRHRRSKEPEPVVADAVEAAEAAGQPVKELDGTKGASLDEVVVAPDAVVENK